MTIFYKAMLTVIVDTINNQIAISKNADQSYLSFGRNKEVSAAKCDVLTKLVAALEEHAEGDDDLDSRNKLEALITSFNPALAAARKGIDGTTYPANTTENMLECLVESLPVLYLKVSTITIERDNTVERPLFNVDVDDNDSLNHFRYSIILFFAKKTVADVLSRGDLSSKLANVTARLASRETFVDEQEKLVDEAHAECCGYLDMLDKMAALCSDIVASSVKTTYPFEGLRVKCVLAQINDLRKKLDGLSHKYSGTTVFFNVGLQTLVECLTGAEQGLEALLTKISGGKTQMESRERLSLPVSSVAGPANKPHSLAEQAERTLVRDEHSVNMPASPSPAVTTVQVEERALQTASIVAIETEKPVLDDTSSTQMMFEKLGSEPPVLSEPKMQPEKPVVGALASVPPKQKDGLVATEPPKGLSRAEQRAWRKQQGELAKRSVPAEESGSVFSTSA